jgi:hypothetical protein
VCRSLVRHTECAYYHYSHRSLTVAALKSAHIHALISTESIANHVNGHEPVRLFMGEKARRGFGDCDYACHQAAGCATITLEW